MSMTTTTIQRSNIDKLNASIRSAILTFRPPEDITVSEWADRYRILPSESAEPGPWRTRRTPYMQEPMDAVTDSRIKRVVMVAGSQVGKSELELNAIGYIVDQDPGNILYIHPNIDDAKKFSRMRVAPMIRACERLRTKVADVKSRDSGNTILQKTFPGGTLTLCGSNSASALASMPIRYVLGDERDRWALSAGTEGDPWKLAKARQTTFYNAKSIEVSTPTVKNASAIETSFHEGTQERWCSKCPDCGNYHNIVFNDIRFEKEEKIVRGKKRFKILSVHWVCPSCGCCHAEATMKKATAKWIAENPDAYEAGVRSFWLNAFVSPWLSWEDIILEYLEALGDTKKLQVVYNTKFGELWEDRGDLEDEDSLMARREHYDAELPDGVLFLTCGVDTQDNRLEYEIVGHGHFGENWGIKRCILMGRPDSEEVWQRLDDVIDRAYSLKDGKQLKIACTFVDSGGHFTQEVYQFCRERQAKKVFAIRGVGGDNIPFTSPPKQVKIVIDGKYYGTCWLYNLGVDAGKQRIMDSLRVRKKDDGPTAKYSHFPSNEELGYGSEYFTGLLSERLVYKPGKKNPWTWEKIPGHERNEPLDLRNYANAAFKAYAPDLDAEERRLKASVVNESPAPRQQARTKPAQAKSSRLDKYYDSW